MNRYYIMGFMFVSLQLSAQEFTHVTPVFFVKKGEECFVVAKSKESQNAARLLAEGGAEQVKQQPNQRLLNNKAVMFCYGPYRTLLERARWSYLSRSKQDNLDLKSYYRRYRADVERHSNSHL